MFTRFEEWFFSCVSVSAWCVAVFLFYLTMLRTTSCLPKSPGFPSGSTMLSFRVSLWEHKAELQGFPLGAQCWAAGFPSGSMMLSFRVSLWELNAELQGFPQKLRLDCNSATDEWYFSCKKKEKKKKKKTTTTKLQKQQQINMQKTHIKNKQTTTAKTPTSPVFSGVSSCSGLLWLHFNFSCSLDWMNSSFCALYLHLFSGFFSCSGVVWLHFNFSCSSDWMNGSFHAL